MQRKSTIDLLRGFIIILMAIDHVSGQIARVHFAEVWGVPFENYPDLGWWFTRFVTHLCAPGFFFLMGMSMLLFAEKRRTKGWSKKQILVYFWKRSGVILLLMCFLEFPAWALGMASNEVVSHSTPPLPGTSETLYFAGTVLLGLAMSMFVGAFLWFLKKWQLGIITLLSFLISGLYINFLDAETAFYSLETLFLVPSHGVGILVIYPLIPWLGIATFGMLWAKLMQEQPTKIYQYSLWTGLSLLAIFFVSRSLEFGNFQRNDYHDIISFFTFIKYPPSLVFATFTCGFNLVLFYLFSKIKVNKFSAILQLFGQTAMFFYIAHLWLYGILSFAFPMGCSLLILYLIWAISLVPLYFLCRWYLNFKNKKAATSIWRMI